LGRIEMHLRSCVQQEVEIAGESFQFKEGETIHTENSYKYYPEEFYRLASSAGWKREKIWLAPDGIFAIMLLHNADTVRD
ncbi:L-histidine N(alpha)-methyltransferase, partial [Idiomarina abyssalis]|uniref:L-histidine N(alpha)-methyltransferase n=3 Tax=Idiomarinaceae TaxID=267893 RepID=UPI00241C3E74